MALSVTPDDTASALALASLASSSGVSIVTGSETLVGGAKQQGTYSGFSQGPGTAAQPQLTMTDGIALTSGSAEFSTSTNTQNSFDASTGTAAFAPMVTLAGDNGLSTSHNDTNVLSFDFVLDDPTENSVTAEFLFATDEFPTQSVTDIMAIFVNGINYAFFPNGDLVANQSGDPNSFFNNNPVGSSDYGIEYNGLTDVFGITMLANGGGAVNTIDIAIADTSDSIFDSALFFSGLKAGTTSSTGGGIGPVNPSAVPLPAAGWMLIAGVGGLAAAGRRKRG